MSYAEFSRSTTVRPRKPRRCWFCNETIAIGERCIYAAWKYDGDFFTAYEHPECRKWVNENLKPDDWEDLTRGSIKRPPADQRDPENAPLTPHRDSNPMPTLCQ